jgi:hypothetical protein
MYEIKKRESYNLGSFTFVAIDDKNHENPYWVLVRKLRNDLRLKAIAVDILFISFSR